MAGTDEVTAAIAAAATNISDAAERRIRSDRAGPHDYGHSSAP